MNTNAQASTFALPPTGESVKRFTQYGMRYPSGDIVWGKEEQRTEKDDYLYSTFEDLAIAPTQPGYKYRTHAEDWSVLLRRRALAANLDVEEYAAQHQLVTRQIIVLIERTNDHPKDA